MVVILVVNGELSKFFALEFSTASRANWRKQLHGLFPIGLLPPLPVAQSLSNDLVQFTTFRWSFVTGHERFLPQADSGNFSSQKHNTSALTNRFSSSQQTVILTTITMPVKICMVMSKERVPPEKKTLSHTARGFFETQSRECAYTSGSSSSCTFRSLANRETSDQRPRS